MDRHLSVRRDHTGAQKEIDITAQLDGSTDLDIDARLTWCAGSACDTNTQSSVVVLSESEMVAVEHMGEDFDCCGDNASMALGAKNTGKTDVFDVQLVELLPQGVTYVSTTAVEHTDGHGVLTGSPTVTTSLVGGWQKIVWDFKDVLPLNGDGDRDMKNSGGTAVTKTQTDTLPTGYTCDAGGACAITATDTPAGVPAHADLTCAPSSVVGNVLTWNNSNFDKIYPGETLPLTFWDKTDCSTYCDPDVPVPGGNNQVPSITSIPAGVTPRRIPRPTPSTRRSRTWIFPSAHPAGEKQRGAGGHLDHHRSKQRYRHRRQ